METPNDTQDSKEVGRVAHPLGEVKFIADRHPGPGDDLHRQLTHSSESYGYFVRLFYIEDDDSFVLEWRLPHVDACNGVPPMGEKRYVNIDDCYFSLNHCIEQIARHDERINSPAFAL